MQMLKEQAQEELEGEDEFISDYGSDSESEIKRKKSARRSEKMELQSKHEVSGFDKVSKLSKLSNNIPSVDLGGRARRGTMVQPSLGNI